jgi:hypothetical protein
MVQIDDVDGANLWVVGAENEQEARDMVDRNIGLPILSIWATENTRHIAIGELRLDADPGASGRRPPDRPVV